MASRALPALYLLSTHARMRAARPRLYMLCAKLWVGTAESQTVCPHLKTAL